MLQSLKQLCFLYAVMGAGYGVFFACLTARARQEVGFRPLIVFAVLAAAAFLAPNLILLHAVFLLLAPIMARSREEAGMILLVGMLATPQFREWIMIGSLQLTDQTVQMSLGLGALAALFLQGGRRLHAPRSADFIMLLFICLSLFIGVRGTSASNLMREGISILIGLAIPYYVFARSMHSLDSIRRALLWLTGAGAMLSMIVIFEVLRSWAIYGDVESRFGIVSKIFYVKFRLGWMRAYGPYMEATILGFVIAVTFIAALASRRAFSSRLSYLAVLGLLLLGLLPPQSRGAWLGAGVAAVCVTLYRSKGKPSALILSTAVLGATAYLITSFGNSGGGLQETVDYREDLLRRGIQEFWKSPVIGESGAVVVARMRDMVQGEGIVDFVNAYLYYALHAGAVGLAVFAFCLLYPPYRLWRDRSAYPVDTAARDAGAFCLAMFLSTAAMISVAGLAEYGALLLVFAMGISGMLPWLASREKSVRRKPRRPMAPVGGLAVPRQAADRPHA